MTREDLRTELYNDTGTWYTDSELDDYIGYKIEDDIYINNSIDNSMKFKDSNKSFFHSDEDEALLSEDLIEEVNDLFSMVLNKAKIALDINKEKIEMKHQIDEIAYFTKIFICKCVLFVILQNGQNKGYKWKYL